MLMTLIYLTGDQALNGVQSNGRTVRNLGILYRGSVAVLLRYLRKLFIAFFTEFNRVRISGHNVNVNRPRAVSFCVSPMFYIRQPGS